MRKYVSVTCTWSNFLFLSFFQHFYINNEATSLTVTTSNVLYFHSKVTLFFPECFLIAYILVADNWYSAIEYICLSSAILCLSLFDRSSKLYFQVFRISNPVSQSTRTNLGWRSEISNARCWMGAALEAKVKKIVYLLCLSYTDHIIDLQSVQEMPIATSQAMETFVEGMNKGYHVSI